MKTILTLSITLCYLCSSSQPKESFYVLDAGWKQTVADSAKYLVWVHENEEGNWVYNYYHMWGPMIKMETYKDHDGTELDGLACYYYQTGNLDSVGHFKDGKKEGEFYKYRFLPGDTLVMDKRYDYQHDSLTHTIDYSKSPRLNEEEENPGDKEPEYGGGFEQWKKFLIKNLHYPDRAVDNEKQGEVRTVFIVDEQGNVIDPAISKSVEYSLDREALRMIRLSGKWEPAIKNGRPERTLKIQPIKFVLQTQ